jgi:hypothetical protein
MGQEESNTGVILAIVAVVFFLVIGIGFAIYMNKSNSSPPTNSDDNSNDNSKNKDKHNSKHKDKDKPKHKDDSDDSDDSDDPGNSKNNKTKQCQSNKDCSGNSKNKTCNLDCVDSKQNNKCVFIGCPSVPCTKNSDCQSNTSKTVCDLKKKVCDINTSIIITGKNGKSVTLDPKIALTTTGYNQTQTGCFSLDHQSDWQDALKDGQYCRVKSITLPDSVNATTYYTNGGWYDICSKTVVEQNIPAGSVDHTTKDTACGFKFTASDT